MDKADCTLLYIRIWYYTQYFPKTAKQPRVHLTTNNTRYITPPINPQKTADPSEKPKNIFPKNRLPNRHPPHRLSKLLLFRWATENRKPVRRYHSVPKHLVNIFHKTCFKLVRSFLVANDLSIALHHVGRFMDNHSA